MSKANEVKKVENKADNKAVENNNAAAEKELSVAELQQIQKDLLAEQQAELDRVAAARKAALEEIANKLEEQKKKEKAAVVKRMIADIDTYGITAHDLGFKTVIAAGAATGKVKLNKNGKPVVPRGERAPNYVGPKGQLWAGAAKGTPAWITESGKDKEAFKIPKSEKKQFEAYKGLTQLPEGVVITYADGKTRFPEAAAA